MVPCCVRCYPAGRSYLLSILIRGCTERKYACPGIVLRYAVLYQRMALVIQTGAVQGQVRLAVFVNGIFVLRVIFPDINGGKIIFHLKALDISGFFYMNIDICRLHITLFIGTGGLFQNIIPNRYMVNPVRLGGWDWLAVPIQFEVPIIIIQASAYPAGVHLPLFIMSVFVLDRAFVIT